MACQLIKAMPGHIPRHDRGVIRLTNAFLASHINSCAGELFPDAKSRSAS